MGKLRENIRARREQRKLDDAYAEKEREEQMLQAQEEGRAKEQGLAEEESYQAGLANAEGIAKEKGLKEETNQQLQQEVNNQFDAYDKANIDASIAVLDAYNKDAEAYEARQLDNVKPSDLLGERAVEETPISQRDKVGTPSVDTARVNMANPNLKSGSGSSSGTSFNNDRASSEIYNFIDNGIFGGTPEADAYRKTHTPPTEPEYDPRREKALNWQKAIIALGKLGGVIHDTKTVQNGGFVFEKPQGEKEMSVIDTHINNLKQTFAKQYSDYLTMDKEYRNGLYTAYKNDLERQRKITEKMIPQYKDTWKESISWGKLTPRDAANVARRGGSGSEDANILFTAYGTDSDRFPNHFWVTPKQEKSLNETAVGIFMTDRNALRDVLRNFAENGDYVLGTDITHLTDEQLNALLAKSDQMSVRGALMGLMKKYPSIATQYLIQSGNPAFMRKCELYAGVDAGTFSIGEEEKIWLANALAHIRPEAERLSALQDYMRALDQGASGIDTLRNIFNDPNNLELLKRNGIIPDDVTAFVSMRENDENATIKRAKFGSTVGQYAWDQFGTIPYGGDKKNNGEQKPNAGNIE